MADLENLLLEAAGRTGGSSRGRHSAPPSRRQHGNAYSDDGSDSKEKDSEDDNRGYGGRKSNAPQVPLKKRGRDRVDDQESQDDEEGDEGSDRGGRSRDDPDVGSDLYKDEDKRQQLLQMSELERELILSGQALKLDYKKLQEKVKSRWKNDNTPQTTRKSTTPLASSRGVRVSTRYTTRASHKVNALIELRLKRIKQQGIDTLRSGLGSRGYSALKRKSSLPSSAGVSSSSQSDRESDSQSENGISKTGGRMDDSDDEMSKPKSNIPTYEDIKGITIKRSRLAKWFMEPFFEDLIVGCFVRVGIGMNFGQRIYRLCIVRNVDASDPNKQYKLENKKTHKYLNCVWGSESSAARWQMARISDSPPPEEEYNQWKIEVERTNGRMPTKQEVAKKKEEIEKTNTFVYSAETVKHMLQEKKSSATRPLNIAAEKERLRREMEAAQYRNNETHVEKIKARLEELAAVRQVQENKNSKALRLAEMNRKNRVENFKNASELKPIITNLKLGEAGYDPFSRRWTRSTNYYASGSKNKANGDALEIAENNKRGEKAGVVATATALEAAFDARKLVDTSAPVDKGTEYNMLHNFGLPISLKTLKKFGGPQGVLAGFMARKQKIEATIGLQVPENDGKKHALALSVSDYKRRRGLL